MRHTRVWECRIARETRTGRADDLAGEEVVIEGDGRRLVFEMKGKVGDGCGIRICRSGGDGGSGMEHGSGDGKVVVVVACGGGGGDGKVVVCDVG